MSLMTLFAKHHAESAASTEAVPQPASEDKEMRCRMVMLDACIFNPLQAYRDYIATGMERGLTELNESHRDAVERLRNALEAELAS
jgi:hypothetical protein